MAIGVGAVVAVREPREDALGRLQVGAVRRLRLQDVAPDPRLELLGSPRGDDPAVVDDDDLVGKPVGLVQVLRRQQHRRASGHEGADHLPQLEPASRIQAGGRFVQVEKAGPPDEAGGEIQPAPHPARVVLD